MSHFEGIPCIPLGIGYAQHDTTPVALGFVSMKGIPTSEQSKRMQKKSTDRNGCEYLLFTQACV